MSVPAGPTHYETQSYAQNYNVSSALLPVVLTVREMQPGDYSDFLDKELHIDPVTTQYGMMLADVRGHLRRIPGSLVGELRLDDPEVRALVEREEYEIPGDTITVDGLRERVEAWRSKRQRLERAV